MVDIFAYSTVTRLVRTPGPKFKKTWVIIIRNKFENNNMKRVCIIEFHMHILHDLQFDYEIDGISVLNILHYFVKLCLYLLSLGS